MKKPLVFFDPAISFEDGQGGLRILLPDEKNYINYSFIHTVSQEKNADIWRMSIVFETDEKGNVLRQLTKDRAEWEMAVRLEERPDFIGGYNHGDERFTALSVLLDEKETAPEAITAPTPFTKLSIKVNSIGYDPKAQSDAVFEHVKNFYFTENGVILNQEIHWLKTVRLDKKFKSFLAMMPPLKHHPKNEEIRVTDTFYTDHSDEKVIETLPVALGKTHLFAVKGRESKLLFEMRAENYAPLYPNSYSASLSDNGKGHNYHKMYIPFAGGANELIEQGTVWTATTRYKITTF